MRHERITAITRGAAQRVGGRDVPDGEYTSTTGQPQRGCHAHIAVLIEQLGNTVKARSLFDNKNGALFPNQFVNTRLLVNTLQGVTLIPASAIQQNGQASFVYVIQNNIAHMRSVKPGVTDGGLTQVDGISPGEVVANSSFDKLQDNTAVAVSNKPSSKPAAAATTGSSAP